MENKEDPARQTSEERSEAEPSLDEQLHDARLEGSNAPDRLQTPAAVWLPFSESPHSQDVGREAVRIAGAAAKNKRPSGSGGWGWISTWSGRVRRLLSSWVLYQVQQRLMLGALPAKVAGYFLLGAPAVVAGALLYKQVSGKSLAASLVQAFGNLYHFPGPMVLNDVNIAATAVNVVMFFMGTLTFALILGVITEDLNKRYDHIRQGSYPVTARNHTLILGWSCQLVPLLRQMEVARRERGAFPGTVVILADRPKPEMDADLASALPHTSLDIATRPGAPSSTVYVDRADGALVGTTYARARRRYPAAACIGLGMGLVLLAHGSGKLHPVRGVGDLHLLAPPGSSVTVVGPCAPPGLEPEEAGEGEGEGEGGEGGETNGKDALRDKADPDANHKEVAGRLVTRSGASLGSRDVLGSADGGANGAKGERCGVDLLLRHVRGNPSSIDLLEEAGVAEADSVIILSRILRALRVVGFLLRVDGGESLEVSGSEESIQGDAELVSALLLLEACLLKRKRLLRAPLHVLGTIRRPDTVQVANHILARLCRGKMTAELLQPDEIAAGVLTQMGAEPRLRSVLATLIGSSSGNGTEVFLRSPGWLGISSWGMVRFAEVAELARKRGETAIG
ncbi:hypothetical protein APUTEX25_001297 [Auxenochlorella protothecoides]|uniref:Ion channel POLLUX n=1 Tax=Auxenochlorella protothecoides TaxID=3075 RepID=A0A3M7KNG4_AUXPR|nr:hypothetical protein APUTEX25_001297 [Auxenochlorella protothecoides]|eukprot:RMZ52103.1 hypothetical protein APUTEX25_001297 [Auxenochlorella protothecoides]